MANEYRRPQLRVSASDLSKYTANSKAIEQFVDEILDRFASELLEASKDGNTSVLIDVPVNFAVANISNKNAQTMIYYQLVNALEEKDFVVKIPILTPERCVFHVGWATNGNDKTLDHMMGVVAARMQRFEEAKKNPPHHPQKKAARRRPIP